MQLPIRITFRQLPHSDALEAYVRERAAKLVTYTDRITDCHVTLEAPHNHSRHGRNYRVASTVIVE